MQAAASSTQSTLPLTALLCVCSDACRYGKALDEANGLKDKRQWKEALEKYTSALEALNPLRVERFSAEVDMADDGWLEAAVHIRGTNPQRNGLPVVFNDTQKENVLELLRSLRIGERITDRVMTETRP